MISCPRDDAAFQRRDRRVAALSVDHIPAPSGPERVAARRPQDAGPGISTERWAHLMLSRVHSDPDAHMRIRRSGMCDVHVMSLC